MTKSKAFNILWIIMMVLAVVLTIGGLALVVLKKASIILVIAPIIYTLFLVYMLWNRKRAEAYDDNEEEE